MSAEMPPPAPIFRHGSSEVSDPVHERRSSGTLQRQDSLPKMPTPALETIVANYLATAAPLLTPEELATTTQAANSFLAHSGPALYEKFLEYDAANENYIEHFYREMYTGATCSNYSLNPNFVLFPKDGCDTASKRAADLTMSCLQYHHTTRTGDLPVLMTKKGSLCMRQMPWLFGSARVARVDPIDDMVCHIDVSKHIVVICRGMMFKLRVLADDSDSIILTMAQLEAKFDEISAMAAAATNPEVSAVGALSTMDRDVWAPERARLTALDAANAASFTIIDQALFVVSIDSVGGLSIADQERNVLYGVEGTVANRWMDKWNIIVCADGNAGLNWEHSMLDGHTMMEFFAAVAAGFDGGAAFVERPDQATIEPLTWVLDDEATGKIASAVDKSMELSNAIGIEILEYPTFGASFIKSCKCSPDGFTQAAFTIAFEALKGRLGSPYESVLTKAFKHGRVSVARNMSPAVADGVARFKATDNVEEKIQAFRDVVTAISGICATAAKAQEFDRPFLALRKIAENEGMPMELCADPGWAKINALDLCTSHCGKPPIRLFGYEPPSADGYSVGYFVTANNMQMAITHFDKASAAAFKTAMTAQLDDLKALFESAPPPAP